MANPYQSPSVACGSSEDFGELVAEFRLTTFERLVWLGCGCFFSFFAARQSQRLLQRWQNGAETSDIFLLSVTVLGAVWVCYSVIGLIFSRIRVFENGIETRKLLRRKFHDWKFISNASVESGFYLQRTDGKSMRFYQPTGKNARLRLRKLVEKYLV